jgi:Na+-driven multidrug efflux pump
MRAEHVDRHDLTRGSLARNIWYLAWPILLTQLVFIVPGLYDAIWLGNLGPEAQAAAGLATSVRITMISVSMALSGGSGAVVARYVGAKNQERANLAMLQAAILLILSASSLGVIGVTLAEPLMRLVKADATVLPLSVRYARILFAGLIATEMVPGIGGILNAAGAPGVALTMRLWGAAALLVAEPLLVRWLGLEGAALALVGSDLVGSLWGWSVLIAGQAPVRLDVRNLRLDFPMMGQILRIALPTTLQCGTPNLAMSLLTRLVSAYGAVTLAAWVVVQRILAQIPGTGLARVTPAMVGQNLGAGDTLSPMAINLVALWLVQVPLAYLLPLAFDLGANGIWLALVIGWFVQAALMIWRYRRGHWKSKQI